MASYEDAVIALYQGSLESFVAERKRLSAELKGAGDKDGSAKLLKLARPSISAWVVNQLYWRERDAFDELLERAAQLRAGDLGATTAHREALARLRARAATLLTEGAHGSEATLRKVAITLSALAAAGGFDPDLPGALAADREPPGFEAFGFSASVPANTTPSRPTTPEAHIDRERKAEEERRRQEERRLAEEEREKKRAEQRQLEEELRAARGELERRVRELSDAENNAKAARSAVENLEKRLAALA
jgi:hypothetical protein